MHPFACPRKRDGQTPARKPRFDQRPMQAFRNQILWRRAAEVLECLFLVEDRRRRIGANGGSVHLQGVYRRRTIPGAAYDGIAEAREGSDPNLFLQLSYVERQFLGSAAPG